MKMSHMNIALCIIMMQFPFRTLADFYFLVTSFKNGRHLRCKYDIVIAIIRRQLTSYQKKIFFSIFLFESFNRLTFNKNN